MKLTFNESMITGTFQEPRKDGFTFGLQLNLDSLTQHYSQYHYSDHTLCVDNVSNFTALDIFQHQRQLYLLELFPFYNFGFYREIKPPEECPWHPIIAYESSTSLKVLVNSFHFTLEWLEQIETKPLVPVQTLMYGNLNRTFVDAEWLADYFKRHDLNWEVVPTKNKKVFRSRKIRFEPLFFDEKRGVNSSIRYYVDTELSKYSGNYDKAVHFYGKEIELVIYRELYRHLINKQPDREYFPRLNNKNDVMEILEDPEVPTNIKNKIIFNLDQFGKK